MRVIQILYGFVTIKMISWRTKFRRGMIEADNQVNLTSQFDQSI